MEKDFWCDFVAGWVGGCAGLVVGHPLDTIKVRQQILRKMTSLKGITSTFRYEGIPGFYKGMGFPLLATGALNALFFGVYANTLRLISPGSEKPTHDKVFVAGCVGGLAQLVVACPVDLIKIKMQMQTGAAEGTWGQRSSYVYEGPTSCLKDLYRRGGVKGCYTGLVTMMARDVPSFGTYVVFYDAMIAAISGSEKNANAGVLIFCGGMADVMASGIYASVFETTVIRSSPLSIVLAGGVAGVVSWMSILPLDVLKSRLQADNPSNPQYKGMWDCLVKSYKADGLSVFGRGLGMMALRAFPTNGAIFLGYVTSLNLMKQLMPRSETADIAT